MKTTCDIELRNFEFWSGAIDNRRRFTDEEMDQIEYILEDVYYEGIDETTLNDIMWFEPETLCEWLDLDFEEWLNRIEI